MYNRFGARNFALCVCLLLGAVLSRAQELATKIEYVPGDIVPVTVTFKQPAKIGNVTCDFSLVGSTSPNQTDFGTGFGSSGFTQLSDVEYHLTAPVPKDIASGTYKLVQISVWVDGIRKSYRAGTDFKEITIPVGNPKHVEFPQINNVTVPEKK